MLSAHRLRITLETLLSPLEVTAPEAWQDAVCSRLRELSGTDVVFFRLSDRGPSRIDPVVPLRARELYRSHFRDLDPWPRHRVPPGEGRVATHERLVGRRRLRRDVFYHEFMRPHGVCDYVGVQLGITAEVHAHVGIFNSGRSRGESHALETERRLRGVLPALQNGLQAWWTAQRRPEGLGRVLDDLEDALLLFGSGRAIHANRALVELIAGDPEPRKLREALEHAGREQEAARGESADALLRGIRTREVRTRLGSYRVRAVVADPLVLPAGGVLLMVEPPARGAQEPRAPGERFGLTAREEEVARLLAAGHSNAQIVEALGIGAATARNHTARVLRKLGVHSRAAIHSVLHP